MIAISLQAAICNRQHNIHSMPDHLPFLWPFQLFCHKYPLLPYLQSWASHPIPMEGPNSSCAYFLFHFCLLLTFTKNDKGEQNRRMTKVNSLTFHLSSMPLHHLYLEYLHESLNSSLFNLTYVNLIY